MGGTWWLAYINAVCTTGRYPDDWEGRIWNRPIKAMVVSPTADQQIEGVQRLLAGDIPGRWGEGLPDNAYPLLPKDSIVKVEMNQDVTGAIARILIRWKDTHEISTLYFKTQGQKFSSIMGWEMDLISNDEFPENDKYFFQQIPRIVTNKGSIIVSATPEHGQKKMAVIKHFRDDPLFDSNGKPITYYRYVSIYELEKDGVPHKELLDRELGYPEFERPFRVYGRPMFGSGILFKTPDRYIEVKRSDLPDPRNCRHIIGLDWGMADYGAMTFMMSEIEGKKWYIWKVHKFKDMSARQVAYRYILPVYDETGIKIPVAWDHGATQRDFSGESVRKEMLECGVNMLKCRSYNAFMTSDQNNRAPLEGIKEMARMMEENQLFVLTSGEGGDPEMKCWWDEKRDYALDENGQILKKKEARFDIMDASRHGIAMRKKALFDDDEYEFKQERKQAKMDWNVFKHRDRARNKMNKRSRLFSYN